MDAVIVSFIWGAVILHDPVKNIYLTLLGLFLLIVGIFGLATVKTTVSDDNKKKDVSSKQIREESIEDEREDISLYRKESVNVSEDIPTKKERFLALWKKWGRFLLGLFCVMCTGLFNGSMMVPARYNSDPKANGIIYLLSFGIGVMIVTPVIFVLYFLLQWRMPVFHFKVALLPGLATGLIWSIGNAGSTYATLSPLGLTVGFPLTQCALLVAGIWGMTLFREIKGWKPILQFFIAVLLFLLPGCGLLAIYGKS